nr:cyclin-dependent kinase inhibitor 1C-like [Aegilops tauschii subsp. strangulata]
MPPAPKLPGIERGHLCCFFAVVDDLLISICRTHKVIQSESSTTAVTVESNGVGRVGQRQQLPRHPPQEILIKLSPPTHNPRSPLNRRPSPVALASAASTAFASTAEVPVASASIAEAPVAVAPASTAEVPAPVVVASASTPATASVPAAVASASTPATAPGPVARNASSLSTAATGEFYLV